MSPIRVTEWGSFFIPSFVLPDFERARLGKVSVGLVSTLDSRWKTRFRPICYLPARICIILTSHQDRGSRKVPLFKVYVGNLENGVTLEQLKVLFKPFEDLEDLVLVMDPETGESRCFAIAMFRDPMRGQLVIETLQGKILNGRPLVMNEAQKKGKGAPKPTGPMRGGRGMGGGSSGFSRSGGPTQSGGAPRFPARPPSGRPSNRPFSRGNARRDGGSSGFSRGPGAGESGASRPAGSAGFSRPPSERFGSSGTPPIRPPASSLGMTPAAGSTPGVPPAVPQRSPTPKPPVVRRSDTPASAPDAADPKAAKGKSDSPRGG